MTRIQPRDRILFASGMIAMGIAGLRFGSIMGMLQEIPAWVPARTSIPYAACVLMLAGGIGLVFERSATLAARVLLVYSAAWVVLLSLPTAFREPLVVNSWASMAHITLFVAAAWILAASLPSSPGGSMWSVAGGARGIRFAQILFGLSLPPLGLAHFAYFELTAPIIPAWIPFHTFWAYFTGAAMIVAGFAVLASILPRLAATLQAVMLAGFTVLVWPPAIAVAPTAARPWTALAISWACAVSAWVVAGSFSSSRAR
jgi:uncharacterized membrane protein